jgi:hypothetical protein
MQQHGRLAGFGNDAQENIGNEPPRSDANKWSELAVSELERDDDVFGSGIFDRPGRMTSNVGDGVFASDYSLPGYVAREVPYAVSRDVTDVASGGEVVYIPGGGFYHVEQGGSIQPSAVLGPTARPPMLTPPVLPAPIPGGPGVEDQPYVTTQPEYAAQAPLYPMAPVSSGWVLNPARPKLQQSLSVRSVDETTPPVYVRPIQRLPRPLGQEETSSGPSAGQMAVAGILLGVSVGLLVNAVRGAGKVGRR